MTNNLTIVAICALLAACGSGGSEPTTTAPTPAPSAVAGQGQAQAPAPAAQAPAPAPTPTPAPTVAPAPVQQPSPAPVEAQAEPAPIAAPVYTADGNRISTLTCEYGPGIQPVEFDFWVKDAALYGSGTGGPSQYVLSIAPGQGPTGHVVTWFEVGNKTTVIIDWDPVAAGRQTRSQVNLEQPGYLVTYYGWSAVGTNESQACQ